MEKVVQAELELLPDFDAKKVIEFILVNLPNASNQIFGDAEAVFHELHFNNYDVEFTFTSMVESGGIDAERFETALNLLVRSLSSKTQTVTETLERKHSGETSRDLGELALTQVPVKRPLKSNSAPRSAPIVLSRSNGIDLESDVWQDRALCKNSDPEAFYPENGRSPDYAIEVCKECLVKKDCYNYAIENREIYGIWGASTERQRDAIFRKLKRQEHLNR
jgi:WhiB family redox-sensing transcriptional regulator